MQWYLTCVWNSQQLRHLHLFATPWTVPTRLLCLWNFSAMSISVGCHFLLQGIFPTQGLNPRLLYWQAVSLSLSHQGSLHLHCPPQLPHHSVHTRGLVLQLKSRARGEHGASACTVLLRSFLVLVWASPLSGEMEKENTFLPHHAGEASAKTSQSLVNNTTNHDWNP